MPSFRSSIRSRTRGWSISATTKTPGATPLPTVKSTRPSPDESTPPSAFGTSTVLSSSREHAGPCIPGLSGRRPVALAMAAISTMVLEPSTNSTSIRGFMWRRVASSM